jgi:ribosomal protein L15
VGDLSEQLDFLLAAEIAEKKGKNYLIDMNKIGPVKILGRGMVTHPIQLHTQAITSKAKSKIESAGGKVITETPEE